jgi:hypothetical protein
MLTTRKPFEVLPQVTSSRRESLKESAPKQLAIERNSFAQSCANRIRLPAAKSDGLLAEVGKGAGLSSTFRKLISSALLSGFLSMAIPGCGSGSGSNGNSGSASTPSLPPAPAFTPSPSFGPVQWKLDDDANDTTVLGGSIPYGYPQNGVLVGASSTAQVATTLSGHPAFHLNGQYVSVKLSSIQTYETANLWSKYANNPVISDHFPQDCELARNSSGPNGGDWYCFGAVNWGIGRYESTDLIHWSGPTQVLAAGGPGAWDEEVQVGYAFQDPLNHGEWMLFYRGYNRTTRRYHAGLATASDGLTFVRIDNGGVNDGLFTGLGANFDVTAVMLVGTTYYVYTNGYPGHQFTNVYSSTDDLKTFTADPHNPIFENAFCPTVWDLGGYYYMLIARDINGSTDSPLSHGIALYRSTSPVFEPATRQYLGYAVIDDQSYDGRYLDTPSVPTTDVYRTYAPEFKDTLYMIYAGSHTLPSAFDFTQSLASTRLSALSGLTPIPEALTESLGHNVPISFSFWVQFDSLAGDEALFSIGNAPVDSKPGWYAVAKSNGAKKVIALYLNGGYVLTTMPLAVNTLYQVTIVDSVSSKEVYINGSLVGTTNAALYFFCGNPAYLYIGSGYGTSFQGYISNFTIYPSALSASDVAKLYSSGTP